MHGGQARSQRLAGGKQMAKITFSVVQAQITVAGIVHRRKVLPMFFQADIQSLITLNRC